LTWERLEAACQTLEKLQASRDASTPGESKSPRARLSALDTSHQSREKATLGLPLPSWVFRSVKRKNI
jgi:hypothetical protein